MLTEHSKARNKNRCQTTVIVSLHVYTTLWYTPLWIDVLKCGLRLFGMHILCILVYSLQLYIVFYKYLEIALEAFQEERLTEREKTHRRSQSFPLHLALTLCFELRFWAMVYMVYMYVHMYVWHTDPESVDDTVRTGDWLLNRVNWYIFTLGWKVSERCSVFTYRRICSVL